MGCPSLQETLVILFVIALVTGASRLPQIGDALGRSIRNFKRGMKGENEIDVTPRAGDRLPPGESKRGNDPSDET